MRLNELNASADKTIQMFIKQQHEVSECLNKLNEEIEASKEISSINKAGSLKVNEVSDETANNFLKGRVKNAVKHNYSEPHAGKERDAIKALIQRKLRQGKPLSDSEKQYMQKNESDNQHEISIYIMNLGKYNEGDIVGKWVTLPVDDLQPILDSIGINKEYEEWIIADYDAPFKINEHDDIFELNQMAEEMKDFDKEQYIAFDVLLNYEHEHKDTALNRAYQRDFFFIDANTPYELGLEYVKQMGMEGVSHKEDYFDYSEFGETLLASSTYEPQYDDDNNFIGYSMAGTDIIVDDSVVTETDLGEYHVEEMYGGVQNLPDEELEFYFDFEKFGNQLEYDFTKVRDGYIQV